MEEGLRKLYTGNFNTMEQEQLPDGSVKITLSSTSYPQVYRFIVRDLYGENEEVIDHQVLRPETPRHIKERMEKALDEENKAARLEG
jgi:hypothetical protein